MEDKDPRPIPKYLNFIFGGMAGSSSVLFIQPAELVKIRMQVQKKDKKIGAIPMMKQVVRKHGILGLYDGLSAAILRQCTYTTSRLGTFSGLYDSYLRHYGQYPSLPVKVVMGSISGGVGAIVGNPADLVMIRMSADGQLPPEKRRNYTHVFNAIGRIIKEEGFFSLWRGVIPAINRCIVVNASTLAAYAQARELMLPFFGDNVKLHFTSSMIAGVVCTICALPVDILKTRCQQSKKNLSMFAVLRHIVSTEGPFALYKGLIPMYITIGPQTVIIFVVLEQIKRIYRDYAYPGFVFPEKYFAHVITILPATLLSVLNLCKKETYPIEEFSLLED